MRDFARSEDPAVQAQLDRLGALSLPQGRFGLETISALLSRLGDPQRALPPVFHIAGTNGKGSTCAFLIAMLEAAGHRVHAATSPHLVRYNERIRIAGRLIDDELLAALLKEVLDISGDLEPSFFEVTAAASFLAFARIPADACVIEVGLGGRLDATNVVPAPAACGIAALGIDHEGFLLRPEAGTPTEPLARIAFEKASIARAGVPLVTLRYPAPAAAEVARLADMLGAPLARLGEEWDAKVRGSRLHYRDGHGALDLPLPALAGAHQADNAALAVALLRHQRKLAAGPAAIAAGIGAARWPARLQRLAPGPLTSLVPGREVWLDGAHNAQSAAVLAEAMRARAPFALVFALLANRRLEDVLAPLAPLASAALIVPIPGHAHHDPQAVCATRMIAPCHPAADLRAALARLGAGTAPVLIAGSLYLAGEVLRLNDEAPD
ncbi:MAG: bifunctional folylpolyglutamate synthase/dihydrofolate synthase [Sphingomonadales bacterium]|nr:bifunctional folylpolyglutamate synthase/dihydrofolate synthase [Sphingomonadales bacterium]